MLTQSRFTTWCNNLTEPVSAFHSSSNPSVLIFIWEPLRVLALHWLSKRHTMHGERRGMSFRSVHHFSMVSDPSTHSKQYIMNGVFYSCETSVGTIEDLQRIPPSLPVHGSEQDIPDELKLWLQTNTCNHCRFSRNARHFTLSSSAHRWGKCLHDFVPPAGIYLALVLQSQVRVVLPSAHHNQAVIVSTQYNSHTVVCPDALAHTQCNILALGLDQGTIGTAVVAFAVFSMGATILPKWDTFHWGSARHQTGDCPCGEWCVLEDSTIYVCAVEQQQESVWLWSVHGPE